MTHEYVSDPPASDAPPAVDLGSPPLAASEIVRPPGPAAAVVPLPD